MRSELTVQPGMVTAPGACTLPHRPADAPAPGEVLPSHYEGCVGCGDDHPTGLHMILVAGEGLSVDGRFCVTDHHQGAPGLAHGGLVATAMDEVLGALGWLLRTPMVTGRLQVEYLKPVPVGTELWLHAQVDGVSERRIYCQAQAHAGGADGPILARAFAVFVAVPIEHFRQHGRADLVQAATEAVNAQQAPTAWAVNP